MAAKKGWVVGWYDQTDHEHRDDVEENDSDEDPLRGCRNSTSWILGLRCRKCNVLDTGVSIKSVVQCRPETSESSESARHVKVLDERARIAPIAKADG